MPRGMPKGWKAFPLTLFEFTYLNGSAGARGRRVVFVWTARDREDADEAFREVIGMDPGGVAGLKVEVRKCEGWPRGKLKCGRKEEV